MGAQAMSSHQGSGGVSRQGSLCGLALSEVEGQLHGVNLDDLLRTGGGGAGAGAAAAGRKTVDEVWRDIQGATGNGFLRPAGAAAGQMTLEDFLSRAGADSGSGGGGGADGARWARAHHHHVGRPVPRPLGLGAGPVLDALYHDGPVSGSKRAPAAGEGAAAEKTVERRKKRMIKNRESAARSRARKQAYTNELENKISRLEEENKRLRMHKAPEPVVQYVPQQEPKNQLRRVNSADF
ncbi:ABSCISIC ACID-INSENSITIVE 5-like protein 2 [Oryza sativa Japonica Group]|nr:ABSCISIC ACID-INSENSITIVE 5-like protein 2 [Oryza sativa Japonica Group]XP_052149537.1 ABSCISIC ACID-INSENSITIVE 5-like protein 2 [Oryza glaberrima]KAF2939013.1 hypothetical protein DAI22_03g160500 [Oryza sativa Japonica Group]